MELERETHLGECERGQFLASLDHSARLILGLLNYKLIVVKSLTLDLRSSYQF